MLNSAIKVGAGRGKGAQFAGGGENDNAKFPAETECLPFLRFGFDIAPSERQFYLCDRRFAGFGRDQEANNRIENRAQERDCPGRQELLKKWAARHGFVAEVGFRRWTFFFSHAVTSSYDLSSYLLIARSCKIVRVCSTFRTRAVASPWSADQASAQ